MPDMAAVRRSRRISVIWIIPVVAIGLGLWLAWETLSKEGPTITISFDSAEGFQAGQSQLKFKNIVLGTVKDLRLTPDHAKVVVTVATTREAQSFLTDDAIFWVVKPRLFAGNVSGLETLLSGAYIGMRPGTASGRSKRDFVGSEDPPVIQADVPGKTFLLKAARLGSISLGSPVFYRDLQVGEVLGWDLARITESATIYVFVREPFDSYIDDETRFWNASGISLKLGGAGVELQLEFVRALLLGGIAFDLPESRTNEAISREKREFPLYADHDAAKEASYSRIAPAISYFTGSVRGLAPGSEVVMHGLKVGRVVDVHLEYDRTKNAVVVPVRYEIQPERILGVGAKQVFPTMAAAAQAMLKQGLRAKLESGSLITGQQLLALDFIPGLPEMELAMEGPDFVLPVVEGAGFASLEASAGTLLQNVNAIPFAQIGQNLDQILGSFNRLAGSPQTESTLTDLSATVRGAQVLVEKLDGGLGPTMKQLPGIAADLQKVALSANRLIVSLGSGYGDNTKFNHDLERLMTQLNDAVRSIRALADLLTRHPEALIRGRAAGGVE